MKKIFIAIILLIVIGISISIFVFASSQKIITTTDVEDLPQSPITTEDFKITPIESIICDIEEDVVTNMTSDVEHLYNSATENIKSVDEIINAIIDAEINAAINNAVISLEPDIKNMVEVEVKNRIVDMIEEIRLEIAEKVENKVNSYKSKISNQIDRCISEKFATVTSDEETSITYNRVVDRSSVEYITYEEWAKDNKLEIGAKFDNVLFSTMWSNGVGEEVQVLYYPVANGVAEIDTTNIYLPANMDVVITGVVTDSFDTIYGLAEEIYPELVTVYRITVTSDVTAIDDGIKTYSEFAR